MMAKKKEYKPKESMTELERQVVAKYVNEAKSAINDGLKDAEAHFMTLLLNVASGRLADCNVVDVFGLGEATVGETIDFIDELLSNPDRTRRDCLVAMVMANQARIGVRLMPSDMDAE